VIAASVGPSARVPSSSSFLQGLQSFVAFYMYKEEKGTSFYSSSSSSSSSGIIQQRD